MKIIFSDKNQKKNMKNVQTDLKIPHQHQFFKRINPEPDLMKNSCTLFGYREAGRMCCLIDFLIQKKKEIVGKVSRNQ